MYVLFNFCHAFLLILALAFLVLIITKCRYLFVYLGKINSLFKAACVCVCVCVFPKLGLEY